MPTVMITGANRGIGLEMARQYAAERWRVIACCRRPEAAGALQALDGDIHLHRLDVTDASSLAELSAKLTPVGIDVLINNAGVFLRARDLVTIDQERWLTEFRVNTIGPVMVVRAFLAHLIKGQDRKIVSISSRMGAFTGNDGGFYGYRTSKAALNMAMLCLAQELAEKGMIINAINPGWVQTEMGGPMAERPVADAVSDIRQTIARLTPGLSGAFLDYNGVQLPW